MHFARDPDRARANLFHRHRLAPACAVGEQGMHLQHHGVVKPVAPLAYPRAQRATLPALTREIPAWASSCTVEVLPLVPVDAAIDSRATARIDRSAISPIGRASGTANRIG